MERTADAVIIGAGPAGLAAAACLRRAGVSFELLEREDRPAASWRRHYDRLHLHTPKQHSSLPHLPFPPEYPTYPSREQVVAYLEAYIATFELGPRVSEPAMAARRANGGWEVATPKATYHARHVVIATGLNGVPHRPTWPGLEAYRGRVLHSSEFRNGAPLGGESVLVVGFGNSGGEIAIDLVEHGARPALAVRSPVNVMPRDVLGIPLVSLTIRLNRLPTRVLDAVAAPFGRLVRGDLTPYGLRSRDYGPATQIARDARIPLIDVGTIRLIRERRIRVHPGIERFTERGVVFTDGTEAEFSAVILATGYRPDFGFLEGGARWAADPRAIPRRGRAAEPGLHFTGFYVANTGTLREIGMEAQGIAYWVNKEKGRAKGVREA